MAATIGRASPVRYGGLEQFLTRGSHGGVEYCIAGSKPYALEFANGSDVICLLLGDIVSRTRFEDDREKPLVFQGETAAFHPRQGNVRVAASSVRNGFVAFSYSDEFQASISDRSLREARKSGSANNIRRPSIRHLARYARERLRLAARSSPLEIQYLGGMVYIETVDGLSDVRPVGRAGLSDAAFRRLTEFIDAGDGERHQLRGPRPGARPAAARAVRRHQGAHRPVGLPVRAAPAHRQGRGAADALRPRHQRNRARLRLRLAAAPDRDAVEEARQYAKAATVQLSTGHGGQFTFLPRKSVALQNSRKGQKVNCPLRCALFTTPT